MLEGFQAEIEIAWKSIARNVKINFVQAEARRARSGTHWQAAAGQAVPGQPCPRRTPRRPPTKDTEMIKSSVCASYPEISEGVTAWAGRFDHWQAVKEGPTSTPHWQI
jgi:hypothetical protein